MRKFCKLFIVLIFLQLHFYCSSQLSYLSKLNPIKTHSVDNYGVFEDSEKFIWILSQDGMYKFASEIDNINSSNFDHKDIWHTFKDQSGRVWCTGETNELTYIENGIIHRIKNPLPELNLIPSCSFGDTILLKPSILNGSESLNRYKYTINGNLKIVKGNNNFNEFYKIRENNTTVYRKNGLFFYSSDSHTDKIIDFLPMGYNAAPSEDDEKVFFNSDPLNTKIYFYENEYFKGYDLNVFVGEKVKQMYVFRKSYRAFLETDNGILYYSNIKEKVRDYNIEKVLNHFYQRFGLNFSFILDSNDNIWLTIKRGEVYFINKLWYQFSEYHFPNSNDLLDKNIVKLEKIGNSTILVSRNYKFFLKKSDQTITKINFLPDSKKKGLYNFRDKLFWIEDSILVSFSVLNNKITKHKFSRANGEFCAINEHMILFSNGILFDLRQGTEKQLFKNSYKKIVKIKNLLFLYSSQKFKVLDEKKDYDVVFQDKFSVSKIIPLSDSRILVQLENFDLFLFDQKGKKIGKVDSDIKIQTLSRYKNHFLVSSYNKLYFLSLINARGKYKFIVDKVLVTNFGALNVQIQDVSIEHDTLLIATNTGVYHSLIPKLRDLKYLPLSLILTETYVNGVNHKFERNRNLQLLYNQNNLKFKFDVNAYSTDNNFELKYKLVGLDSNWSVSKTNIINLTFLSSGDYQLIVCATNGIASSDLKTIRFTISTPFWRSVWFILLCFVIFLLSVFVIVKRIIAKNKLSIERKNKLVSLELATLKSQLNPHFIFNSLNNIQYLVFQKDEEKTSEYISSFSNLMRGVLNNSRNAFISLKDEIDFLTNYVNIQSMKLKDEISLNINYEDIDINETWIRSMILQPFVENSVIHGLTLKEGTKKISINFRLIDNILEVDIIDNGIGRKAANKFKEQSSIKLKSISTSIIKEKGHILNKFFNEELVFEYEDLFDGDSVLGTKVLLRMNYKMGDLN